MAQLKVDGRNVCLDTLTSTLLATVPEAMFGHDATLQVEKMQGWQDVTIDGTVIDDTSFLFSQLSAESKWTVKAIKADGTTLEASLQFTFLPIVQLVHPTHNTQHPTPNTQPFSNEYQQAKFLFSYPDSATTDTLTAKCQNAVIVLHHGEILHTRQSQRVTVACITFHIVPTGLG